jgi:signal transduction histidine kinase
MGRRHTILVVDDEADVIASVQDLLRLDYRVLGATRAEDGLQTLRQQEVHVVLTDQRMPGMSGVEFLRRVRESHPEVTRLLFTGYADIKAVIDAINQGNVFRYIAKPWDPEELQTIIRQAAERFDLLEERKRLLTDLRAKNEELEQTNRELRQAHELKAAFIKVASHELRTPLTILMGLTDLALRAPGLAEPLKGWLTHAHKACVRLQRLVDQLIQMLLVDHFDRPLDRTPTDVAGLLETAAEDVRPFVEQRRQVLALELAPDLGTLKLDAVKIRDGLDHLLLNAIKFTPDGGTIRLAGSRTADRGVLIQVADTGLGIDPVSLPYIFQPFFTAFDVSRHSSGQFEFNRRGLGLGLSLVKAFVEMHGGRIEVASQPGQGTTFTITLPVDTAT